jgi:hypothetical protein
MLAAKIFSCIFNCFGSSNVLVSNMTVGLLLRGCIAILVMSYFTSHMLDRFDVYGSRGSVKFDIFNCTRVESPGADATSWEKRASDS